MRRGAVYARASCGTARRNAHGSVKGLRRGAAEQSFPERAPRCIAECDPRGEPARVVVIWMPIMISAWLLLIDNICFGSKLWSAHKEEV